MVNELVNEYIELKEKLKQASESYYYGEKVMMTDYEYDQAYLSLQDMEAKWPELITPDSPTQKPGAIIKTQKTFKTGKHKYPMLSLKTETDFTEIGAFNFDSRVIEGLGYIAAIEYVAELKFDGLGIDLVYEKGFLVSALTRGDGTIGEEVIDNVKMIPDIPKYLLESKIPKLLIVRGEIFMSKESFKELNDTQVKTDSKPYINARNAAAGSLRVLDPMVTRRRRLNFFAYTLTEVSDVKLRFHMESLTYLKNLGFPICEHTKFCMGGRELAQFHSNILSIRESLPFEIDGVVYKVNDLSAQERLGYSGREPKWAVAHKFPAQEKETTLLGIDVQVGRTGKLTPVARVAPIFVGGATVSNITLHNESEIHRKDLRVGDTVVVRRAGDVIPEITGIVNNRDESQRSNIFEMPKECPVCGSEVFKEEDIIDYRCSGTLVCPAQLKAAILHFTERAALDVKGLGPSLINELVDKGFVTNIADLYSLGLRSLAAKENKTFDQCISEYNNIQRHQLALDTLTQLDRVSQKTAKNILDAIQESKHTTLKKFIYALGIRYAGEGTAKRLVNYFKTLDNIMFATPSDMLQIRDIGARVALSVYSFFQNKKNVEMINHLTMFGIRWDDDIKNNQPNKYCGLNIVLTGSFTTISRQELKVKLESLGANVSSSVSKSTHLVVAGPGAGMKLAEALKLNIKVIDENTLMEDLNNI